MSSDVHPVQHVLDQAVREGLCPGAVACIVGVDGDSRRFRSGNRFVVDGVELGDEEDNVVDEGTVYDLASLTKLLCTTALLAKAVDDDAVGLDEVPFPQWDGVTVAHLLQHTAGLAPHRPFFELAERSGVVALQKGRDVVVDAVLAAVPEAPPGARTRYSDLGFIALGALLEQRLGDPLDVQFERLRGATSGLQFVNLWRDGYHPAVPHVAPSERCPWRRRHVQGQVHDENAYAMGGVAGHAGLFGSLEDVEGAAVTLLRALQDDTTLRRFARAGRADGAPRGLGFDRPSPGGATGDALSDDAVGHLGFTGTSLWLDPRPAPGRDGGTAYVLLANTVSPTRDGVLARNKALRRAFHRAAALGEKAEVLFPPA
jgi:CubicO group peptidase (beta-lactamase class C family)